MRAFLAVAVLLAALAGPARADLYSWTEKGVTYYSSTPPKKTSKKKRVTVHKSLPTSNFEFKPGAGAVEAGPSRPAAAASVAAASSAASTPSVELFTTASCSYCAQARAFLAANGIAFKESDVENDAAAYQRFRALGGRGVPLALIGGSPVSGFSPEVYRRKLGLP